MIPYHSAEGRNLRDIGLSRSGIFALWASAIEMNQTDWAKWARLRPIPDSDPNKIALMFLHAAAQGQKEQMGDLSTQLESLPTATHDLFYVRAALALVKMISI